MPLRVPCYKYSDIATYYAIMIMYSEQTIYCTESRDFKLSNNEYNFVHIWEEARQCHSAYCLNN